MLHLKQKIRQKFFVGRVPRSPDGEVYSTPPNPLAGLRARAGRRGEGREEKEGRERSARANPLNKKHGYRPGIIKATNTIHCTVEAASKVSK